DSESKIYTVLEGNRRFTALKLLENPQLAECRPKIVQQFKKLQQRYLENPYKTVFCVVYNDRSLANRWIELKHTNDNKGVGTERWRPLQQGRFNQNSLGLKQEITAQVLDIIYENDDFPDDLREQLEDVPFTNLKRLLSNSQARTLMGFTLQNKEISISKSGKVVSRIMEEIIRDLLPNPMSLGKKANIVVSDIYSSEAAVEYINQVLGRLIDTEYLPEEEDSTKDTAYSEEPFPNNVSNTPNDNLSEFNEEQNGNSEEYELKPRGIRPQNRKKLRTRGEQLLPITVPKIATLYQELIGITMCEPVKTLVSIGMRSLIEMSCTNYIRAHSKGKPSVRISDNLI
ncbi:MAG: hypothetical protein Q8T08_25845, partial [Ignavibacteria bacterium]|nr:hypothetical protein [Ignavibacteria bacterium]